MRFAALHLRAYGHFTDRVLQLPRTGNHDLHLIVGDNEAGKSTLLAAVGDFLFRFPHHAERTFLHEPTRQRVGATIDTPDGGHLHLLRRRGTTNTLRPFDAETGAEDTANPQDAALQALLSGGLDRGAYRHLFGLDLHSLTEGGEALMQGEGEVGQALFQAAAGVARLRQLQQRLRAEADELFSPRANATRPVLNQALARHRELGDQVRAATVRTAEWESLRQALEDAEREHAQARLQRDALRLRQRLLERVKLTLPRLAERQHLVDRLAGFTALPLLAPDARERRLEAEQYVRTALQAIADKSAERERKAAARVAIVLRPALLERAATLDGLFQRIPGFQAALEGLEQQRALQGEALLRMREQGRALGLEEREAEALRRALPSVSTRESVQALAGEEGLLRQTAGGLRAQKATLEAARDSAAQDLACLPPAGDLSLLSELIGQLATLGPAGEAVGNAGAEHSARSEAAREATLRLGHADPEALARLAMPTHAGAQSLASRFERLATERQRQQAQAEELSRQRKQAETRLAAEVATGEVATEAGLADARADRDAVLRWLYRGWLDGDEAARWQLVERAGAPGASAVVAATGEAVTRADKIADALRLDAGRVERHAALARELEHLSQQEAALVTAQGALTRDAAALASEWQALVSPLAIGEASPESLLEWLDRHRDFLQLHEQARAARQRLDNARGDLERLLGVLDDALARFGLAARSAGESPLTALARLKALQTELQQTESQRLLLDSRRDDASRNLQELTPRLDAAEAALSRWEGYWATALRGIGLSPDSLSAEARARLDRYAKLEAAVTDVEACVARMATHEQTLAAFAAEVSQLAEALGEAAPEDDAAAVARVEAWHASVAEAQAAREQVRQLEGDIQALGVSIAAAQTSLQSARGTLESLCRDAGVADVAALPAIEQQAQARAEAATRLDELEASLRTQFGKSVEELMAEAEGHEPDALGLELEALGHAIAESEKAVGERHEALITARLGFAVIDGSEEAAHAAQEQAVKAAEIDTLAHRWVRVRLADTLLAKVIEVWRARHQGPLMERASAIFARLTLGSFEGLTTDFEDEHQRLLGVRPGGGTVGVDGMSQGTRDQLFLALRLSTIEGHIASRGPFPVIADDLLVQFDDDRALATLEVLLELSRRTQVLLFTHHRHLQQVVERAGLAQQITLSQL